MRMNHFGVQNGPFLGKIINITVIYLFTPIEHIKMMQIPCLDLWPILLWTKSVSYKLFKSLVLKYSKILC